MRVCSLYVEYAILCHKEPELLRMRETGADSGNDIRFVPVYFHMQLTVQAFDIVAQHLRSGTHNRSDDSVDIYDNLPSIVVQVEIF